METKKSKVNMAKVYAAIVTALLFASLVGVGILFDGNLGLKTDLQNEKLASEKLLSEKLLLDKEISQLKSQISDMGKQNSELSMLVKTAQKKAADMETSISKLKKENQNLQSKKKEVDELKKLRDQLMAEVDALKKANQQLLDKNQQLQNDLNSVLAENQDLKDKLKKSAVLKAGNFRVEVGRKNSDKLTVKARKTHEIMVSFDLPQSSMANMGKKPLYLVITGPDGKVLAADGMSSKTVYVDGVKQQITPTATQEFDLGKTSQRVTLKYNAHDDDLSSGVYKVEVYTDDMYLGNNQFRLMK